MKTIVHVNQHIIRANTKNGTDAPALIVKDYKNGSRNASSVQIHGPSEVVYQAHQPLSCGARCWIQTQSEVTYD